MKSNQIQPRVLSIQSHVVSGYCGNKSATFPLQVLGFEVDPINTVQFSNHNQYKTCVGQIISHQDLEVLVKGLRKNDLDEGYTHILTGFISNAEFLHTLAETIKDTKQRNTGCMYVCDPVLGDAGKLYVPEGIAKPLKDVIIPLADVIVPNQFEAEYLTGITIKSLDSAIEAMNVFHTWGVPTVVISSAIMDDEDNLVILASQRKYHDREPSVLKLEVTKQKGDYVGTGDLFAALLTAWLYKSENDMTVALERTVSTLQHVIRRTLEMAREESPRGYELKLIQSKAEIESPQIITKAMKVR